jgi:hypothetical protein
MPCTLHFLSVTSISSPAPPLHVQRWYWFHSTWMFTDCRRSTMCITVCRCRRAWRSRQDNVQRTLASCPSSMCAQFCIKPANALQATTQSDCVCTGQAQLGVRMPTCQFERFSIICRTSRVPSALTCSLPSWARLALAR